jgi:energy-coupling factor transport system ATP-binding protein
LGEDSPEALISARDLGYRYKSGLWVLRDLNLEIRRGEFVAIVGRNGSGKSTLSRVLAGIEAPGAGRVLVKGMDTKDRKKALELRKTVGIVFQNPETQLVFEEVADDIAFGLHNLGLDGEEARERIKETSALMGIEGFRSSFELSMGQKQRVAIASVLAMRPECLIFDEPTAMLDPRGKKEIHRIIVDLHRRGLTVIYVTNVIDEVLSADRIVILNRGTVQYDFEKRELFQHMGRLKDLGLETPFLFETVIRLREKGLDLELADFTIDELTEQIVRRIPPP